MHKLAIKISIIISLLAFSGCGDECLYFCDMPSIPTDCAGATDQELASYDQNSREFLEAGYPGKSFSIMDCIKESGENFTDKRKMRWLVSYFESQGFNTTIGLLDVLFNVVFPYLNGETTIAITSIDGFLDVNETTQANYISSLNELMLVRNSMADPIESDIASTAQMMDMVLSLYALNAYAYRDQTTPNPNILSPFDPLVTPIPAAAENFINDSLLCGVGDVDPDVSGGCGQPGVVTLVAEFLASNFHE